MLRKFPVALCIVALAATAFGDVQIFDNRADFDNARDTAGCNVLVGIEDFDTELTTEPLGLDCYPYPPALMQGVPNPPGAPVGLLQPMDMYSDYFDPYCDLVSLGPGAIHNVTTAVGPNFFAARSNADFINYGGYCAVGFEVMEPSRAATGTIDVYDLSNVLLGSFRVPFPFLPTFYGVVADDGDTIGRIEFYADNDGGELVDNIELYIGEGAAGCPQPGASGKYCTADVFPNNGDGIWDYAVDGDCIVDLTDLSQLLANYPTLADATHEMGDVWPENGDGVWQDGIDGDDRIDLADLSELLSQYADDCN